MCTWHMRGTGLFQLFHLKNSHVLVAAVATSFWSGIALDRLVCGGMETWSSEGRLLMFMITQQHSERDGRRK